MAVYIVTYDLRSPGQRYDALISRITEFKDTKKILLSAYLINTDVSAQKIYDHVKTALDKNDYIFINQLGKDNQGFLPKDCWDWLNQRNTG